MELWAIKNLGGGSGSGSDGGGGTIKCAAKIEWNTFEIAAKSIRANTLYNLSEVANVGSTKKYCIFSSLNN